MQKTVIFTMSAIAAAAVSAGRFIGLLTGQHCGAGAKAQGVSQYAAATGEAFAVDVHGTSIVESGGSFAPTTALKSDADGKAIAQGGTGEIIAYAVTASTGTGQKVEVLLKF
jgi:hypothetical protein